LDEAVICINPFTGEEEDVYDKFGLRQLDERQLSYPSGRKDINKAFNIAITQAERELDTLRSEISALSQPHLISAENMDRAKKLRKEYDKKYSKLNMTKEALRDAMQGPKYRYKKEHHGKYDVIEGKDYMIKLSDMLDIAILNGTIYPKTDFVVLQACRNFFGQLPSDFDFTKTRGSPDRAESEEDSRGGGGRATSKHSRKKYAKNKGRNKNKNKRKTIRNRKSIKSRNSRKSHKSRKRSNSL